MSGAKAAHKQGLEMQQMQFNDDAVTGRFGVEIEFIQPRGISHGPATLARLMTEAGVPTVDHTRQYAGAHITQATWKIVPDGSVHSGWELVSPPMSGLEAREQIRTVCRVLQDAGCSVNRTTGLHVHHDASNMTATQLANVAEIYKAHQDTIDQMLAPTRRNSRWAQRMDRIDHYGRASQPEVRDWAASPLVTAIQGSNRYYAVNLHAYMRHGTIEFRQHQGTLNATKIWNWIVFTQVIMSRAKTRRSKAPARRSMADIPNPAHHGQVNLFRELEMFGVKNRDEITFNACRGMVQRLPCPLWRRGH